MKPRSTFALTVTVLLLLVFGCSKERITGPQDGTLENDVVGQAETLPPVVNLDDLQKPARGTAVGAFADVAVTNFTGQQVLYPGDALSLSVTLAKIGDLDAVGPATGSNRDMRGGSWIFGSQDCRSAGRNFIQPAVTVHNLGFCPVRSAD